MFRRDCGYFEMECPEFQAAIELKEDLEKFESMWGVFESFNSELDGLRKEDWISFRCKFIHVLDQYHILFIKSHILKLTIG